MHLVVDSPVMMETGFVFLDEVLSGFRWDAKYATWDNFTGAPVDGYEVNRIVGSHALADALLEAKARAALQGFGLLLWDGRALCSIMERSGFERYDCEWWHYALRDEPYPDTYFDFPIS